MPSIRYGAAGFGRRIDVTGGRSAYVTMPGRAATTLAMALTTGMAVMIEPVAISSSIGRLKSAGSTSARSFSCGVPFTSMR